MRKVKRIIIIGLIALAVWFLVAFLGLYIFIEFIAHDGQMSFPLDSTGEEFIEQPHLVAGENGPEIRWSLPADCTRGEYMVVTDDFVQYKHWTAWMGGSETISCDVNDRLELVCVDKENERFNEYLKQGFDLWYVVRTSCGTGINYRFVVSQKLVIPSGTSF
ncbi:MAG: hypothetical protein V1738_02135 [Patescibacteria group bacterium]